MTIHLTPSWINQFNREKIQSGRMDQTAKRPNQVLLPESQGLIESGRKARVTEHRIPARLVPTQSVTINIFNKLLQNLKIKGGLINERAEAAIKGGYGNEKVYAGYLSATAGAFANMKSLQSKTVKGMHNSLSKLASNEIFIRGRNGLAPATRDYEAYDNHCMGNNADLLILRHKRLQETSAECLMASGHIKSGDNVLDVGCGLGEFSQKLNEHGIETVAIEPFMPPPVTPAEAMLSGIIRDDLKTYLDNTDNEHSVVYVGNLYPVNDQKERMSSESLKNFITQVHRATDTDGKAIIGIASIDGKYLIGQKPDNLRELLQGKFDKVDYLSAKKINEDVFNEDGAIGGQIGFFIAENPK